jgi:hypothetical protein
MRPHLSQSLRWTLPLVIVVSCVTAAAGGERVHGENSRFAGNGVVLAWGVLRGASEDAARVVLRVVPTGSEYTALSVEGVDPFTQARQVLLPRAPLAGGITLWTARATFAEVPQREIHLYTTAGPTEPAVTIYFLGLPDTTPEFDAEPALSGYLDETITGLMKGKGQAP